MKSVLRTEKGTPAHSQIEEANVPQLQMQPKHQNFHSFFPLYPTITSMEAGLQSLR